MKKYFYFPAIATMLFVGCTKEQEFETVEEEKPVTGQYSLYAALDGTKTTYTVGDGNGYQWAQGEQISVGTAEGYKTFECEDPQKGRFTGEYAPMGVAVSPVQTTGFTSISAYTVSFPAAYDNYVPGTTNALFIGAPTEDGSYFFYNAGALVQVTYDGVPAGVKKFVFTTGNTITGNVTLSAVPSSENPVEIKTGDLESAGNTVTITLKECPSEGSSLSVFVPVPTGNLGSLQIKLVDEEGNDVSGSKLSLTKDLTMSRKQVLSLPPIQMISKSVIGETDNSTGFWGDHSQYYSLEKGKRLHLKFKNYTTANEGWNMWNNWVLVLASAAFGEPGYSEYLVMRTDRYGWADKYNAAVDYLYRYSDTALPENSILRNELNGATVDMTIDFNGATIFVLVKMTNGDVEYTRHLYISGFDNISSVTAFLTVDNSHIEMLNVYYDNTRGNVRPSSLSVSGIPDSVTQNISMAKLISDGNDIRAKVTWPDGTSTYVDRNDITLSGHGTPGEGVALTATYGKKIYGNNVEAGMSKSFTKNVTVTADYIESIDAAINAVVYGASDLVSLSQESTKVTAHWASSFQSRLASSDYTVNYTGGYWGSTYLASNQSAIATVSYTGSNANGAALNCTADLSIETKTITSAGFGDTATAFAWNYDEPWEVKDGETATIALTCEKSSAENWFTPQIYIKNQDQSKELYRARMDYYLMDIQDNWKGYGWNSEYVNGGNIDWGLFNATNISNAKIYMSVDNNNGVAWITIFWQYYTDSGRSTLIEGNNTVFVNYGKLPIPAGESIYIIPASEYSKVTFIK